MSTRSAVLVFTAGALLGIIFTLAVGQEPGGLLGFFIVVGTIVAALGINRGKVYLLFPAPALAFFVAAIVTGKVHDAKLGSSTGALGAGFTQWVAGIFFPAVVATIIALLLGGGRWLLGKQLVTGQSSLTAGRPAPGKSRPAPRDRQADVDSWADENPFDGSPPRPAKAGPAPRQNRPAWMGAPGGGDLTADSRPPRPSRDQRGDRDPWGDPRLPGARGQGSGPRPQQSQPGTGSRPQQSQPGTGPRPQQSQPGTGSRPQQSQSGTGSRPQQSQPGTGSRPQQSQPGTGSRPQQSQPGTGSRPQQSQPGTGSRPQQSQPGTGSRPQQSQPGTGSRPQANGQGRPAPQPRDRPSRPSQNPGNSRPPRPSRPQPPDGWSPR
jgi:Domain of unknown function (DUF6542)